MGTIKRKNTVSSFDELINDETVSSFDELEKKNSVGNDSKNGAKKSELEIPSTSNDPLSFQGRNEKGKLLANFRNDPPKKVKRTDLVTEDFNTSIYQIKKEDNKNNVVTNSEILGSIKILDEDIPSSILDKSGYRKSLQQRLSLKQPSELDLQVIAAKTKKPIEAVKEYAIGKDGKGIMLEFDGIKAKKSTQLNQLLQSANKDLGLNDSFDAVFSTPETAKAYLDKIQQAYDTKTEQDFNLVNTVEVDGKQVQYTGEFYPERMLEKNFGEGQRIYNLMKSENSGKVNALKGIIGEDIIEKVSKKQGLTYDQKAQEIGKLVYGKDLKQIEEAYNKRGAVEALSAINPMLKLGGIFRDEKEEKKNLNAINSIAEVKLNNAIKEQLIYDQAVLNDTLQEAMSKAEAGTLSDTDRTAYQNKVEQLKKGIEEKQAEYKTPKQLQDKYPVLLKQSLIADINEFNAIKSGNVKQYEDGGYENTNLVQHLIGKGYDMNSQVVKDVIVDAAMSGKEIKDYSFFGSPIKSMTETFTSAIKSLGDITGLRDDVTILSEKKAGELFPTTVSESDELQLSGAAKVGQNIGNTTGQVLGQGLLQAGTAGLGRLAGLSKVAAANSGFWSSGALTSYDAAYKDGYDFIDSNAGRTAYAGLIALSNAASEKIFPEAKLFNIPGVKSAVAELASKVGTKEMTEKLANQLLTKAKNAFIDYGKKYASNVGKETLEETATSLFESGARFVFGDPNINYDKAIENAKNTAIQTAIGTSLIGGMGVHKDVQQEKNIAPSSVIYNAAVYKDEAIDALNIGHDQGLYDQQELNKKISLLNTAEVGLSELKKAEDVFGRELSRPQKELFVANYTAQKLLNEQKKETGEPVIIAKIDERLKNLQNQQTQLLENKAQFDDFGNVAVNTKLSEPIEGVDEQGIPVGDNVPTPVKIESAVIEIGGKQYEGKNHAEAILAAQTDGQDISNVDRQEEGKFKLSDGSIIDRAEAKKQFGQDRSELIIPQDKATNNANKEYAKQLFEKEKTNRGLGVYGSMTAEVAIKEIAKQAQGVTETGEADTPEMTERVYKSTVNQFGKQLTDAAIKAHPIESLLNKAINSKGEPENISQPIELSITPANTEADKGVGDKISAIVDKVVNKKEKLTDEEKQFVEDNKSEVSTAVGKAVIAKNKPNQNTAVENNNVEDNSTQGLLKKYNEDTKYNIYDLVNDIEKSGDVNLKNAVAKYREEQAYDNETSGRNDMTAAEDNFIAAVEQSLSNKQEVVEPKPEIKNEEPIKVKPISDKVKSKFSKIKNKSSETKTIVNKKRTVKAIEVKAADAADNNSPEAAAEVVQEIDNLIGLTAEQQARALGEKEVDGTVVKRQKPLKEIVVGKEVDILFTKNDKEAGNYAVIERSALQPSHKSGVANELHFIPEAQPRDRGGLEVLRNEAKNKSDKLDPNQLADNNIAYFGAPVVNERGEVIQGNGRAEAIDYYYGNDKKDSRGYKEMLQQKASSLGLDAAAIAEMKEPVLVKLTKANDERAIELGNYSAGELEDVKQKGADIKAAFNRLTPAKIAELSATINSKIDETTTLKQIIRDNVRVVLDKLFDLGALRKDNKEQYIKEGEVTPDGIQAAYDIVRKLLFEGGTSDLEAKFDSLPFNTREAIEKTIPAILNNTELKLKVQEAIEIMRDQQESGTSSFATWRIQRDIFGDQKMPSEKYQKELLDFAQGITEAKTQKPIAERIVKLSKAMNETPADMFSPAIPAKNFEEAYNQPDIKFAVLEKADTELQQMKDIVRDIQNEYAEKDEPITLDEIKSIAESELGEDYNEQLVEDAYNEAGKQSRAFKKATAIQNELAKRIQEFTGNETIILPDTEALLSKAEELQNGVQFQKPDSDLLKAENDAIEKWLDDEYENIEGADVEEGYVSFDWDGNILEIFQGRNKAPLEFTKGELIEKGVEFPKNKENGSIAFMKSPDGEILGFTHEGKIYLNGEKLNPNTPVHEAGHIWVEVAKEKMPLIYKRGIELINGSNYLRKVQSNQFYQQEAAKLPKAERKAYFEHEALAAAIGDKGAQFVTEARRKSFIDWAKDLWNRIAQIAGFKNITAKELQDMTLEDFAKRAAADILRGKEPIELGTYTIKNRKDGETTGIAEPAVEGEEPKLSGIRKKLVSEKIIENVDLNRIGDKDMMELGRKIIDSGEINPELLVQKIITEKQGVLTPGEVVALITYKADIDNKLRDAYRQANEKKDSGEDLGTLGIEIKDLERQVDDFDVMAVITANQQSMAFRLRRMMLDRNYNVITQIEKYKKNNDGYIPPEIEARFRELDKELKEVKEKLANAERLAAEKEGQDAVDNIKESVGREKTYTDEQLEKKIQEGVESEISKLYEELPSEKRGLADKAIAALEKFRSKIKANGSAYDATIGIPIAIADLGAATAIRAIKVGKTVAQAVEMGINRIKKALKEKGIDKWDKEADYRKDLTETLEGEGVSIKPVKDKATINEDGTVSIPNQMLRDLVKRGVTDINDFTDAVHEQVVKDLPDITKRQVRDYITNYGKEVNKTADEIQTQINTAKRVGKLLSELEDLKTMGKVEFFAKYQKQKPADNKITEREKELKQQIKSLSKDIIGDTGVDKVGKDAAERHQKRIDDLEKELERLQFRRNKEKKQPNKSEREIPEDEQKILDEIEAEQTKWDEEKDSARQLAKDYQKMETERNRQLARVSELNEAIKTLEGGNLPQGETKVAKKDTPEIEALKAEKASLEKKVRESIAHENKMKELDKELQRLKDRKAKEPKAESKRIIGEEERLKRDEIEAERKAWAIENNIEKLNTELQRVRSRQQKVTDPKEKRELTDTEKGILQEIKDEKAVWAKEVEPERRVREALKSAQKSLKEYERRIAEKDFSKKDVTETPLTPELKSLREKRDAKRKEYEKLKKDTVPKIPKTDAEILKAAKERARARIEQLTTKLKNKDFAKPVKKIAVTDTELADLITRKEKLQDEFDDAQYKLELKNRTFWQKAEDAALELTSGLVRGLVASLDMSAGFVQGLWRLFSNPINSAKAFGTMFNHFKSEKASQDYMDKLKAQPYYPLLQASKLAIDDKSGKISAREGFFISNWVNHIYDFAAKVITLNYKPATQFLQRINPYKASARAFDGYVNSIRVNSFIDLAKSMEKDGYTFEADSKDFEKAADFVNTTTGRGSLGKADASSRWLNIFFFAPRKVISEVKLFTPYAFVYYARMPKSVRKKALLNLATFMGNFVLVNGLLWAASKAAGGDDEEDDNFWNANSSDFLTHKIGNKRVSIAGGAKSMLVFQSRLWSGKFTDQYGNTEKLGERYGKPINTRLDLVWRFVLGKGSPAVSVIAKKFDEKKGVESSDGEIIKDLTVPIWMQDLKELYKDSPKEVSTLLAALSFFGANVRTVDEGNKKKSGFKIYSTSIKGENGVRYSTPKEDKEVIEYKDIKTEEKLKAIKERGTVWLNKYGEMTINEDENVSTKPYKELSDDEIKDLKSRLREQAGREAKMKIKF